MVTVQVSTLPLTLQPPVPEKQLSLSVVAGVTFTVKGEVNVGVVPAGIAVKVTVNVSALPTSLTGASGVMTILASTQVLLASAESPVPPSPVARVSDIPSTVTVVDA